jgi:hypothetical protein
MVKDLLTITPIMKKIKNDFVKTPIVITEALLKYDS